jgi:hypothetical protein
MPKLNRYRKNAETQSVLNAVDDTRRRKLIMSTVDAINGHVLFACIALGMLQLIGLLFANEVSSRFMRSKSNPVPSEATVADHLRRNFFSLLCFFPSLTISAIIKSRQIPPDDDSDSLAG